MKYLAIAVLLTIIVGAALQFLNQKGEAQPPEQSQGWMQR